MAPTRKKVECHAHGRLDVMGGIADYSGSLVLQMPIKEQTTVSVSLDGSNEIRIQSSNTDVDFSSYTDEIPLDFDNASQWFKAQKGGHWASYVLGSILVLRREKKIPLEGMSIDIRSNIPLGKGLSSSAALEIATIKCINKIYDLNLSLLDMARYGQMAENHISLSPCGIMDQIACAHESPGKLIPILCRPHTVYDAIDLPENVQFVGIDSGIRHAVTGASYGEVRASAFMGYSMLEQAMERSKHYSTSLQGHLTNLSVVEYENRLSHILPHEISGKQFLQLYGDTIDPLTSVEGNLNYKVKACTEHPIYEHNRVTQFREIMMSLAAGELPSHLLELGNLMYASHQSYTRCGLGHPRTDELVQMAKSLGPEEGVYGAKITGGGSGGVVCILAHGSIGMASCRRILREYINRHNLVIEDKLFAG